MLTCCLTERRRFAAESSLYKSRRREDIVIRDYTAKIGLYSRKAEARFSDAVLRTRLISKNSTEKSDYSIDKLERLLSVHQDIGRHDKQLSVPPSLGQYRFQACQSNCSCHDNISRVVTTCAKYVHSKQRKRIS